MDWQPITIDQPPTSVPVMTKIDDARGARNEQILVREGNLWFFEDMSMYVYYRPTHFKPIPPEVVAAKKADKERRERAEYERLKAKFSA